MKKSTTFLVVLLNGFISLASAQPQLQCVSLAKTLREYRIETSSSSYLNSVYSNYCNQSRDLKSETSESTLNLILETLPFNFTSGNTSSREKVSNFCKTYVANRSSDERRSLETERISNAALETVDTCLRMQSQGATVTHKILNHEATSFFMQSGVANMEVRGLTTSKNLICDGQIQGISTIYGKSTIMNFTGSRNFNCERKPTAIENGKPLIYDEATISLSTNFGNYDVLWPRYQRLNEDNAANITNKLSEIDNNLVSLNLTMDRLKSFPNNPGLQTKVGVPHSSESGDHVCPAGTVMIGIQAAVRGTSDALWGLNGICQKLFP